MARRVACIASTKLLQHMIRYVEVLASLLSISVVTESKLRRRPSEVNLSDSATCIYALHVVQAKNLANMTDDVMVACREQRWPPVTVVEINFG